MRGRVLLLAALTLLAPAPALASAPPAVSAPAYLVAGPSGDVLAQRAAGERRAPASITKLMTAVVTLEHARPGETVTVPAIASGVGESSIRLRAGELLSVRELLAAALIQSANDAAYALAAHVGRGNVARFVRMMNAKARKLGLADSRFVRPDGLDAPGHYMSAKDVLVLARAALKRPLVRQLVRKRSARIAGGRVLSTWNDLLGSFRGLLGVKTGHTARAGWCEVAFARRDGVGVWAVVLGSRDRARRNRDLARLLNWGFAQYVRVQAIAGGRTYATASVPFSDDPLPLVARARSHVTVRKDAPLVEEVIAPVVVRAPVRRGERVGLVLVREGRRTVARSPLVAAREVRAPSFAARAGWYAGRAVDEGRRMLRDLFGAVL